MIGLLYYMQFYNFYTFFVEIFINVLK